MFEIGIAIGIFSYLIFFVGLAGLLYAPFVIVISLLFWGGFVVWKRQEILLFIRSFHVKHTDPWVFAGVFYLVLQALINSIGLLGPASPTKKIRYEKMPIAIPISNIYFLGTVKT